MVAYSINRDPVVEMMGSGETLEPHYPVLNLHLLLPSCVTLGKLLNLSGLRFPTSNIFLVLTMCEVQC